MIEIMETEDIYSIAISSLVVSPFASEWSSDGHLSIMTARGVHVFELVPSPMSPCTNIKFTRSFIYPSDVLPAKALVSEINSVIWKLKREEIYSLLMETALTPKLDDVADMVPKIIKVAWSPQNLIHPSKCILAILTNAGAIELLHKVATNWFSLCNLTNDWLTAVQDDIKTNFKTFESMDSQFNEITTNVRKVQACAMTWSRLYKIEQIYFAFLVVAYHNSDVVIWRFPRVSSLTHVEKPEIMNKVNLNSNGKINVLCWIDIDVNKFLVVIGYFDGRIQGLKYESIEKSLRDSPVEKYYTYADRISVMYLQVISQNKSSIKILASKGSYLLLLHLNPTGTLISMQHLHIGGFTISGITILDSQFALATTQNSNMFIVNVQEESLTIIEVKHSLPQANVQYLGLTQSPNSTMFVNITSPNSIYDHLIQREPSTIHIFGLKGKEWDPVYILNKNKNMPLEHLWECLEVIRVKALKIANPTIFPIIPENLESLSLCDLRISMWISVMTEVCTKKQVIEGIMNIVGEISDAQPLIYIHSASAYLVELGKKISLSKDQILSINLLRMYFEIYLSGEEDGEETYVSRCARKALNAISHVQTTMIELCNLCGEAINEVPWNATKCPLGHKLPRCALTLLQVTTVQYRTCPICGQIFHPCVDEVYNEVRCLFCDIPALYDSRVIDTQNAELYARNLSKLQGSVLLRNQELEAPIEDDFRE